MIKDLLTGNISQNDILSYYNASIKCVSLPNEINGYVFNYRNINCIVLNKNKSYDIRKKTLLHELAHIELSQLEQYDNDLFEFKINKYEDEADRYIKFIEDNISLEEKCEFK